MKYMLDIVLIVGLLWIGYLWNGEKQAGLEQGDRIDELNARVARLELDLGKAKEETAAASADLAASATRVEQLNKELQDKTDELSAKAAEADELRTNHAAAVARVKELEGYKAKAIVAEMPKPIAP